MKDDNLLAGNLFALAFLAAVLTALIGKALADPRYPQGCGNPDGNCWVDASPDDVVCDYFKNNPLQEHRFYAFSQAATCWMRGGHQVGGITPDKCRGDGWAGLRIEALDHEYLGHMAYACSQQTGIPQSYLAAAMLTREFNLWERCPGYHQWTKWRGPHLDPNTLSGTAVSHAVPDACVHLQKGPG